MLIISFPGNKDLDFVENILSSNFLNYLYYFDLNILERDLDHEQAHCARRNDFHNCIVSFDQVNPVVMEKNN